MYYTRVTGQIKKHMANWPIHKQHVLYSCNSGQIKKHMTNWPPPPLPPQIQICHWSGKDFPLHLCFVGAFFCCWGYTLVLQQVCHFNNCLQIAPVAMSESVKIVSTNSSLSNYKQKFWYIYILTYVTYYSFHWPPLGKLVMMIKFLQPVPWSATPLINSACGSTGLTYIKIFPHKLNITTTFIHVTLVDAVQNILQATAKSGLARQFLMSLFSIASSKTKKYIKGPEQLEDWRQ